MFLPLLRDDQRFIWILFRWEQLQRILAVLYAACVVVYATKRITIHSSVADLLLVLQLRPVLLFIPLFFGALLFYCLLHPALCSASHRGLIQPNAARRMSSGLSCGEELGTFHTVYHWRSRQIMRKEEVKVNDEVLNIKQEESTLVSNVKTAVICDLTRVIIVLNVWSFLSLLTSCIKQYPALVSIKWLSDTAVCAYIRAKGFVYLKNRKEKTKTWLVHLLLQRKVHSQHTKLSGCALPVQLQSGT